MSVFKHKENDRHQLVAFHHDEKSGLNAIIAIHNTLLGPAVGGCRMYPYCSEKDALHDVLRLSKGMTYKSALANLPIGGGKAVIIADPKKDKTRDLLLAMGRFIESLKGQYISSVDIGMVLSDIHVLAEQTRHIIGLDHRTEGIGPAASTAKGVFRAVKVSVAHCFDTDSLNGIRVAIQGLGSVGFQLAKYLVSSGARVFVADIQRSNVDRAVNELGVDVLPVDKVLAADVDVLSPCAMGSIINKESIKKIKARVVVGAANNQLATTTDADGLRGRGILYAPDFVINAGGIIDAWHYHNGAEDSVRLEQLIEGIGVTLLGIFQRAELESRSTHLVAMDLAQERLNHAVGISHAA